MNRRGRALILVAVQLVLVLSVAANFLRERKVYPRVWTQVKQVDPTLPLRGRYLALQLLVNGCSLPMDVEHHMPIYNEKTGPGMWMWTVSLKAEHGELVPVLVDRERGHGAMITRHGLEPCERLPVSSYVDYFIPDAAHPPFPLKVGEELWVETTVPREGPPRPIQLAVSSAAGFRPLTF